MRLGPLRMIDQAGSRQLPLLPAEHGWRVLDERARGTSFVAITPRSVLNSPATTGMEFWSVNPYVGCEFGCSYCYARDTHRYAVERENGKAGMDAAGLAQPPLPPALAFERQILVKRGAGRLLLRSLDPARVGNETVMIGTATDPYQPAERRFRVTREILEALSSHRGLSIGIITKSPLVVRDLDLLRLLSGRGRLRVHISLATTDARLARRLEARSPTPAARLRALGRLTASGIEGGLLVAPIIPGITDGRDALSRLFAAGRAAGARHVMGSPLRLGPAARAQFLPHLAREFPELLARYQRNYGHAHHASAAYQEALAVRVDELREEHGYAIS